MWGVWADAVGLLVRGQIAADSGLHHFGDRFAERADVVLGDASPVDATGADDVDGMLFLEGLHVIGREPGEGEHPALLLDKRKVAWNTLRLERIHEQCSHTIDAAPHLVDFSTPDLF